MSLAQQLSEIPKTLLAIIVISLAVGLMFVLSPPHSLCDTQVDGVREALAGPLFPIVEKKRVTPARLAKAREGCRGGNTAGACYEYFNYLKAAAQQIRQAVPECREKIFEVSELSTALTEGIEAMALAAWGGRPPVSSAMRFGWLQESELATFCLVKDAYVKAVGDDKWNELRLKINRMFPDERPVGGTLDIDPPRAIEKMSDQDIWMKSLFSVRCDTLL